MKARGRKKVLSHRDYARCILRESAIPKTPSILHRKRERARRIDIDLIEIENVYILEVVNRLLQNLQIFGYAVHEGVGGSGLKFVVGGVGGSMGEGSVGPIQKTINDD